MYEGVPERLLSTLVATFGDEPRWAVDPGRRSRVFYLRYNEGGPSMQEIRSVIEQTVPFGGQRDPGSPPLTSAVVIHGAAWFCRWSSGHLCESFGPTPQRPLAVFVS